MFKLGKYILLVKGRTRGDKTGLFVWSGDCDGLAVCVGGGIYCSYSIVGAGCYELLLFAVNLRQLLRDDGSVGAGQSLCLCCSEKRRDVINK